MARFETKENALCRLRQEFYGALEEAGYLDMISGSFNVGVVNQEAGVAAQTQGNLLAKDYTWQNFFEWLTGDMTELDMGGLEDLSIEYVEYAGPLSAEEDDSEPTPAEYAAYRKVQKYYRMEDAKEHVEERISEYHKRIFTLMVDEGKNPDTDTDIQALDRKITVLDDADFEYLASQYIKCEDCDCAENDMWEAIIDVYVSDRLAA